MKALYGCYEGAIQALDKPMRALDSSYIKALEEHYEDAIWVLRARNSGARQAYESARWEL